jgi:hypothetical protein
MVEQSVEERGGECVVAGGRKSWGKHRRFDAPPQSGICPIACGKFLILDCPLLAPVAPTQRTA